LGWKELGRSVRKGQRALTLCMPVTCQVKETEPMPDEVIGGDGAERPAHGRAVTSFVHRAHWFVLSQTDGEPYDPPPIPEWREARALASLMIDRVRFQHMDGNAQGYASGREVAVSPIAFLPHRTLFHELAHVVLGHTQELQGLVDRDETTPKDVREVEAECVALICCESLGLTGCEFSRGYIQHWLAGRSISEKSAQNVLKAADTILRAGRPQNTVLSSQR
jgi:hypothetical protein